MSTASSGLPLPAIAPPQTTPAQVARSTGASTRIVKTGQRGIANPVSEFSALMHTIRDAGLLKRRTGFYIGMFAGLVVLLAGAWVGFAFLKETWFTLLIAAALGILFTQFAFLAHEAAHRQVFESNKANEFSGRMLADFFVGISYSWWMNKHTRHHGNPNTVGKDPDIEPDFVMFREEDAARLTGPFATVIKRQGWLFYPALLFEGLNLHQHAYRTVFSKGKVDKRMLSITLLMARNIAYLSVVFYFLPLGMAFAFIGVQLAVFGFYMGASFAPNHIGMRILPAGSKVDFLRRQVLTSRNVTGGWFMSIFMGGLNFQVEHHLFPNMPRPNLKKASEIVREYCRVRDIEYTENNLFRAHAIVLAYMNKVGLAAGSKSFDCPTAMQYGR
jgi:fatty acid desaturase